MMCKTEMYAKPSTDSKNIEVLRKEVVESVFTIPMGRLAVLHDSHYLFEAAFTNKPELLSSGSLAKLISQELNNYFIDPNHRFQLPLKPQGSLYQQKVWNALLVIPAGRTLSYGDLAQNLQSSPRAIGQACKKNPLVLFIPCHRVIGKYSLGGYMGKQNAVNYKEALLHHEQGG